MINFCRKSKLAIKIISVIVATILLLSNILIGTLPERNIYNIPEGCIRIMSFNVHCANFESRKDIVPQLIGEYYPDSIGLQECTYTWMKRLKKLLPEYEFVGVGRDNGTTDALCGEISAVLFLKSKYILVEEGTFWLSDTPEKVSRGWDAACNRVCTYVVLENKETGKKYAHINTHLDHSGKDARAKGLELVTKKAMSYSIPTVMTGDLNFREGTALYNQLIGSGLKDSKYLAEKTMSSFTYHGYLPETVNHNLPIDYICVNNIETVKTYEVITKKIDDKIVSDHYPIYADILIEE